MCFYCGISDIWYVKPIKQKENMCLNKIPLDGFVIHSTNDDGD